MKADLVLTETKKSLTYTGAGAMAGYVLVVTKDDTVLDVHQIIPASLANGQTWKALRDRVRDLMRGSLS